MSSSHASSSVPMLCSRLTGLADQNAVVEALACLQGCQQIGMPECDVLLAQCAVRLARAPKSREVYCAMRRCQQLLARGPLPPVPLHLRNAPTKLMKQLGMVSLFYFTSPSVDRDVFDDPGDAITAANAVAMLPNQNSPNALLHAYNRYQHFSPFPPNLTMTQTEVLIFILRYTFLYEIFLNARFFFL